MNARRTRTPTPASAVAAIAAPIDDYARLVIEHISPTVDGGRYPPKRLVDTTVDVSAVILKDGHDQLAARVRFRAPGETAWQSAAMTYDFAADRWHGPMLVDQPGRWTFVVEGWTDVFGTWREALEKKVAGGVDVRVELLEGAELLEGVGRRLPFGATRSLLRDLAVRLSDETVPYPERARAALAPDVLDAMTRHWLPRDLVVSPELPLQVDRARAGFAAWYELFPRSATDDPARHGTFADAERQLPRLAALGFDVVYLPPIHPIGRTFRKGRNNSLTPEPTDVGSPWAIGGPEGGHDAVHPDLGTLADFERFVARAAELGLDVALDFALQASPDHPWV
ncbi:MAG TPA: maltotransferase domain-containing protein, partial [Gemmatimonadaceae bacterium]|nr:maltotransferase domain-containing protein [Gemmatimonadaceae bacterium]